MATYYIENNLVCAIVNNDYTGVTDEEDRLIDDFFSSIGGGFLVPLEYFAEWRLCEITGLYGDCYPCTIEK